MIAGLAATVASLRGQLHGLLDRVLRRDDDEGDECAIDVLNLLERLYDFECADPTDRDTAR